MYLNEMQTKNAAVAGVNAPTFVNYPEGGLESGDLPMALTFLQPSNSPDEAASILSLSYRVFVFVRSLDEGIWTENKQAVLDMYQLFITEYAIVADDDCWIKLSAPYVRLTPGSTVFGPPDRMIRSPDGGQFHGFYLDVDATAHIDAV